MERGRVGAGCGGCWEWSGMKSMVVLKDGANCYN